MNKALLGPLLACAALAAFAQAQPEPAPRPRIGLVLGGGGARGAAHIGVLEVLERLRVPVDCVAGTSMGALVAGAWAAGLSPAEMRAELAAANWTDMFQDDPDYAEFNHRNKRLAQRFLPGSEMGIGAAGAVTPPGLVTGQKIKLFFNHLVRADTGERDIDRLPLPLAIVATDIGTGQKVVLSDGSLTLAMRASMSVPGLMAPLEYRGRKLVDGGLVDNVPVAEVRRRCGAEVVIAVNVGSPPLPPHQVSGLVSVTAQMVALLTEQNVAASLATLSARDILIRPELDGITAADFGRHAEAADAGRVAAELLAGRLEQLGLDEARYAAWQQRVAVRRRALPRIDSVEIAGLERAETEVVRRYVEQRAGALLDTTALNRDLLRAYGDGWYERVDYAIVQQHGKHVLRLLPVEKSWGPDYLRLALRLDANLSQGSSFGLRVGYQKTWLNKLGAELLLTGELGSSAGVRADLYQPFDAAQRYFAEASAEYRNARSDYFVDDRRIAEYRTASARVDLVAGINFALVGQLRAGWREAKVRNELETGFDITAAIPERSDGGVLVALDIDTADRLYFPRRGVQLQATLFDVRRRGYSRLALDLRAAWPWQGHVLGSRLAWTGSPRGSLPLSEAARLGGFLNLSGYATGQLIGDNVVYGHMRAERIIGSAPLGLRGDLRLGIALESAHLAEPYLPQRRRGWLYSLALYLGGESPVGPAFLGLGLAGKGQVNAYLVVGNP